MAPVCRRREMTAQAMNHECAPMHLEEQRGRVCRILLPRFLCGLSENIRT